MYVCMYVCEKEMDVSSHSHSVVFAPSRIFVSSSYLLFTHFELDRESQLSDIDLAFTWMAYWAICCAFCQLGFADSQHWS